MDFQSVDHPSTQDLELTSEDLKVPSPFLPPPPQTPTNNLNTNINIPSPAGGHPHPVEVFEVPECGLVDSLRRG